MYADNQFCVRREWGSMRELGQGKDVDNQCCVRREWFHERTGARQGCVISPLLFLVAIDWVTVDEEAKKEGIPGSNLASPILCWLETFCVAPYGPVSALFMDIRSMFSIIQRIAYGPIFQVIEQSVHCLLQDVDEGWLQGKHLYKR